MRAVPALLPARIFLFVCYSICLFRALFDQSIDQPFQKIRTLRLAIQNLLADFIGIRQRNIERLFGECTNTENGAYLPTAFKIGPRYSKAESSSTKSRFVNSELQNKSGISFCGEAGTTTDARPVHSTSTTPIRRFVWLLRYNGRQIPRQRSI